MEASTSSNGPDGVKTFRGKSLEELLPQIRAELGPDAIVLRRREGTAGGVGGFFARPFVEVDARAPTSEERPLEIRSDRATAEGLSSPAVQALFEQATPFADALAAAARDSRTEEDTFSASFSGGFKLPEAESEPEPQPRRMRDAQPEPEPGPPSNPGLYGPQPNASAIRDAAPQPQAAPEPEPEPAPEPVAVAPEPEPEPESEPEAPALDIPPAPVPSAPPSGITRPPSADAAQERLVASGLSVALAADVVGEAVVHSLPFSAPRNMKRLVRAALARRIPTPTALGPGARRIAFVGGGGAGKSSAVAHLAAVYAASGAEVAVIDLRGDHGDLAGRLQPLGIGVITALDATQAKERLAQRQPVLTLIDTPATGPSTPAAAIKALAADLKTLGAEVHLALPATLSAAAAGELAAALAPLAPTHVALTHADETARPGAPLELALSAGRPLSYVCARDGVTPADPASLAAQLLP